VGAELVEDLSEALLQFVIGGVPFGWGNPLHAGLVLAPRVTVSRKIVLAMLAALIQAGRDIRLPRFRLPEFQR
jgi:hypothetical protein